MFLLQIADVYLFENKKDSQPVKSKKIGVRFSNMLQTATPHFEVQVNMDEEFKKFVSFGGELLRLQTIALDDDEIPTNYLCYDIINWDFTDNSLIVTNPNENIHQYTLPFE